jgi:hypothetical protein
MRIFVGGSFRGVIDTEACHRFVAALGQAIVERGHVLLNGCRNPVDKEIAEAAQRWWCPDCWGNRGATSGSPQFIQ